MTVLSKYKLNIKRESKLLKYTKPKYLIVESGNSETTKKIPIPFSC